MIQKFNFLPQLFLLVAYEIGNTQINLNSNEINLNSNDITIGSQAGGQTNHNGTFNLNSTSTGANFIGKYLGLFAQTNPTTGIGDSPFTGGKFYSNRVLPHNLKSTCVGVYGYAQGGGESYAAGVEAVADGTSSAALFAHGGTYAAYLSGDVYISGTLITPSDTRFKTDAVPISSAMEKLMELRPKSYRYESTGFQRNEFPQGTAIRSSGSGNRNRLPRPGH